MRIYVKERKKRDMREQRKRGCLEVACVNLTLTAEGPLCESGTSRDRSHRNE